jgi:hypothetical protein
MLTGILEIDQEDYAKMLRFNIRAGGNLLVFGPAGCGKTEMGMQACDAEGFEYRYLNLSVLEAPDMMGLPMINEQKGTTAYALPEMLPPKDDTAKPVVLLVDEADKAKPELQNPCLELFQFRSINGRELNIHAVIATGNLPDENAFSQPMSHALTNRCSVYKLTHAFKPWQEWATSVSLNPLIVGFLDKNQEYLLQPPPEGDDTAYCHPSPRAWTLAARDLDNTRSEDGVDFQTALVSGRVGHGAAVKFRVWLEHYRHIEPLIDALAKDGTKPDTGRMGIDRQLVCAIGAVGRIMAMCKDSPKNSGKKKEEHVKRVHQVTHNVMSWVKDLPPDFCIGALKSTLNMKVIQDYQLTKIKPFMDAYLQIRSAMKQS